jgi:CMP-N,N'-diacetyllegionaminic acid synthase
MLRDKKVLGIIPARGGSKGVRRKNIRVVGGKPLIAWTIEEGRKSKYIDQLIISTEDKEIAEIARLCGGNVPFLRPVELAKDDTPGVVPVLHALQMLPGYDYVVLLQPTSPLRSVEDIDGCIKKCIEEETNVCVSVSRAEKSPYWFYSLDDKQRVVPLIDQKEAIDRRQDLPEIYMINGAVYVAKSEWLLQNQTFITPETVAYIMPYERSLDIDSEFDLKIADLILSGLQEFTSLSV